MMRLSRATPILALGLLLSQLVACAASGAHPARPAGDEPAMALALEVLEETPLVDGHNDLPWQIRISAPCWDEPERCSEVNDVLSYDLRTRTEGHTDIERLRPWWRSPITRRISRW